MKYTRNRWGWTPAQVEVMQAIARWVKPGGTFRVRTLALNSKSTLTSPRVSAVLTALAKHPRRSHIKCLTPKKKRNREYGYFINHQDRLLAPGLSQEYRRGFDVAPAGVYRIVDTPKPYTATDVIKDTREFSHPSGSELRITTKPLEFKAQYLNDPDLTKEVLMLKGRVRVLEHKVNVLFKVVGSE